MVHKDTIMAALEKMCLRRKVRSVEDLVSKKSTGTFLRSVLLKLFIYYSCYMITSNYPALPKSNAFSRCLNFL